MQIKLTKNLVQTTVATCFLLASVGGVVFAANDNPLITPKDPAQTTTILERIAERKSDFKVQLTLAQQKNLKTKCAAAQTVMQNLKTRDAAGADNRRQIYTDLATKLSNLVDKLKSQGVDTTGLTTAQKKFNDAINVYLADAVAYKSAMDDTVVLDCLQDPAGFEAGLMSARALRAQLANDVAKIKAVRPALIKALGDASQNLSASEQRDGQ